MKHTGLGWLLVLAVYGMFTLMCAVLAVAFPAMGLWCVQLWRLGTTIWWLVLAGVRMVILSAFLLTKKQGKR